ncbi:MAG: Asp-tRNA(Asn)/Glu-tRNA(Gln) amidotransferase GatCAB subunit B, partial [Actinobacteria bacterium]
YGITRHDAALLSEDAELAGFLEAAVTIAGAGRAQAVANVMNNDLAAHLNAEGVTVTESRLVPAMVAELVALVEDGTISSKQAKEVFSEMAATGDAPGAIVELKGMRQVSDAGAIEAVADAVLAANPDEVDAYRGGKTGLIGFFVGQVMREMGGQGNPQVVNEVLARKLGG